jgi:hypothetical protein
MLSDHLDCPPAEGKDRVIAREFAARANTRASVETVST